jgi:hypothetical protein
LAFVSKSAANMLRIAFTSVSWGMGGSPRGSARTRDLTLKTSKGPKRPSLGAERVALSVEEESGGHVALCPDMTRALVG